MTGQAGQQREEAKRQAGGPDDRPPAKSVGEPAHRQCAQEHERHRGRAQEYDDPVAHPEAVADLGGENR